MSGPTHEAEVSLLGSVLLSNRALRRCADIVAIESFADPRHRLVWASMLRLDGRGDPIDAVTLASSLEADGSIGQAGGLAYLIELTSASATAVNVEAHAHVVAEGSKRRGLYEAFSAAARSVSDVTTPTGETLSVLESALADIVYQDVGSDRGMGTPEAAERIVNRVQDACNGIVEPLLSTGLGALDAALGGGLRRKKQYIIGAPTGVGKTAFAHYLASKVEKSSGQTVLYFSCEVDAEDMQVRELSKCSGVAGSEIDKLMTVPKYYEMMSDTDVAAVHAAITASRMRGRDAVHVFFEPGFSPELVMRKARAYMREHPVCLIVCDYIQHMTTAKHCGSYDLEVTHIANSLMNVAARLDVAMVTLSQMTKEIDKRPGHVPIGADLKYGSGLANNATATMLLDRPEYWDQSDRPGQAVIHLVKNRKGPMGPVHVRHTAYNGRFWDQVER